MYNMTSWHQLLTSGRIYEIFLRHVFTIIKPLIMAIEKWFKDILHTFLRRCRIQAGFVIVVMELLKEQIHTPATRY